MYYWGILFSKKNFVWHLYLRYNIHSVSYVQCCLYDSNTNNRDKNKNYSTMLLPLLITAPHILLILQLLLVLLLLIINISKKMLLICSHCFRTIDVLGYFILQWPYFILQWPLGQYIYIYLRNLKHVDNI